MDNRSKRLREVHQYYCSNSMPADLHEIIRNEFGVSLEAGYLDIPLRNPVLIAPGQLSVYPGQIRMAKEAGYAGVVLKSVVGEMPDGSCSMIAQRKKATSIRTFFESYDSEQACPIIHWDGRMDTRAYSEYIPFAREAREEDRRGEFAVIASLLGHLPFPKEEIIEEEWHYSTKALYDLGYRHMEIDFCPFLAGDDYTEDQENVLSWYSRCPGLMKAVSPDIKVFPKILNLEWGLDFQVAMAEAAVEGGSDGLAVANRIYKHEFKSGHGGEELRQRNLAQVRAMKERFPNLPISATGGVYSGRHVWEYLQAGAENVQILSFIMGKVMKPFARTDGNKMEKVLHKLLLDPEDGLVACMLEES